MDPLHTPIKQEVKEEATEEINEKGRERDKIEVKAEKDLDAFARNPSLLDDKRSIKIEPISSGSPNNTPVRQPALQRNVNQGQAEEAEANPPSSSDTDDYNHVDDNRSIISIQRSSSCRCSRCHSSSSPSSNPPHAMQPAQFVNDPEGPYYLYNNEMIPTNRTPDSSPELFPSDNSEHWIFPLSCEGCGSSTYPADDTVDKNWGPLVREDVEPGACFEAISRSPNFIAPSFSPQFSASDESMNFDKRSYCDDLDELGDYGIDLPEAKRQCAERDLDFQDAEGEISGSPDSVPQDLMSLIYELHAKGIKSYDSSKNLPGTSGLTGLSPVLPFCNVLDPFGFDLALGDEWLEEMRVQPRRFFRPRLSANAVSVLYYICIVLEQNTRVFVTALQTFQRYIYYSLKSNQKISNPLLDMIATVYICGKLNGNSRHCKIIKIASVYRKLMTGLEDDDMSDSQLITTREIHVLNTIRFSTATINEFDDIYTFVHMIIRPLKEDLAMDNLIDLLIRAYFIHQYSIFRHLCEINATQTGRETLERLLRNRFYLPTALVLGALKILNFNDLNLNAIFACFAKMGVFDEVHLRKIVDMLLDIFNMNFQEHDSEFNLSGTRLKLLVRRELELGFNPYDIHGHESRFVSPRASQGASQLRGPGNIGNPDSPRYSPSTFSFGYVSPCEPNPQMGSLCLSPSSCSKSSKSLSHNYFPNCSPWSSSMGSLEALPMSSQQSSQVESHRAKSLEKVDCIPNCSPWSSSMGSLDSFPISSKQPSQVESHKDGSEDSDGDTTSMVAQQGSPVQSNRANSWKSIDGVPVPSPCANSEGSEESMLMCGQKANSARSLRANSWNSTNSIFIHSPLPNSWSSVNSIPARSSSASSVEHEYNMLLLGQRASPLRRDTSSPLPNSWSDDSSLTRSQTKHANSEEKENIILNNSPALHSWQSADTVLLSFPSSEGSPEINNNASPDKKVASPDASPVAERKASLAESSSHSLEYADTVLLCLSSPEECPELNNNTDPDDSDTDSDEGVASRSDSSSEHCSERSQHSCSESFNSYT